MVVKGFYKESGKTKPITARVSGHGNSQKENRARRFRLVQIVYCHKSRVGKCNRHSNNDFIMFDEDGFPWCPKHYPRHKKTNLGTKYSVPRGYRIDHSAGRTVVAEDPQRVGKTIYDQIAQSRIRNEPLNLFKAVGADQFFTIKDGLQFRVKGDKLKGKVLVKLNSSDLYDVEFWKWKNKTEMVKVDQLHDIYADNLVESIWPRIVRV